MTETASVPPPAPVVAKYATVIWSEPPNAPVINGESVKLRGYVAVRLDQLGYDLLYEHGDEMAFRSKPGVDAKEVSTKYPAVERIIKDQGNRKSTF